ncbi:MFS transporter, partial [Escherichia coli]
VWTVGYVLASIAGHHFISENPEAWRWLLASAALPALLITLLRWGTPESPRWLLRQGRFVEATPLEADALRRELANYDVILRF